MDPNRPQRSSTKNRKAVIDDDFAEDAENSSDKRRKFDHKRNAGPGNRPPLISDGNNKRDDESGSAESDFEIEEVDSESDSDA